MTVYTAVKIAAGGITRSSYGNITIVLTPTSTFGAAPTTSDTISITIPLADATPADATGNDAVTQLVKALSCS